MDVRRSIACFAAALLAGSIVHGHALGLRNDGVASVAAELARTNAARAAARGEERETLDAAAESLRVRLLAASPDDDRAATWLLDSAAYSLAQASRAGDDASVLLGLPTQEQRSHVAECADRAAVLIVLAEGAAARAIPRLESRLLEPGLSPDRARDLEAQIEPIMSRLVDVELGERLPAMRMWASVLVAAQGNNAAARSAAQELVSKSVPDGFGGEARKRLMASVLLLGSGDAQQRDSARRQLEWVVSNAPADPHADVTQSHPSLAPGEWVMLHMALIRCGRADASLGLPCPGRGEDWLVDLLLAESAVRAARDTQTGRASVTALNEAFAAALSLVAKHGGGEIGLDSSDELGGLRALVYEKIGNAVVAPAGVGGAEVAPENFTAEVVLARALTLSAAGGGGGSQPGAEAVALLTQVANRQDAGAPVRARTLWTLARVPAEAAPGSGTNPYLMRLVRELPETRLALLGARQVVASISAGVSHEEPCGGDWSWVDGPTRADGAAALRVILRADRADEESTQRLVACLVAGSEPPAATALAEAVALHRALPTGSGASARIEACITHGFERAIASPLDSPARDAILRAAAGWFAREGEGTDGAARALGLRLDRAEGALAAGIEPADRTAADLQALLGTEVDAPGSVDRARLRGALGAALRCASETESAFAILRSVTDEFESDARTMDPSRRRATQAFWSSWAELLEMLAKQGRDGGAGAGENELQTARQRARLELLDPDLGGEPWAGRIRAASGGGGGK